MEEQRLQEAVAALHVELGGRTQVDDGTRALLKSLTADIQRLLDVDQDGSPQESGPLSAQVEGLVRKFEADHPQLTDALNRVASALANMGI